MFYVKAVLMWAWAILATLLSFPFFWVPNAFPRWIRFMSRGVLAVAGIESRIVGAENLEAVRPCVIAGNHQSYFDFVTFGVHMPNGCTGVGKKEIALIPVVGWFYAISGGFLIHRKNRMRAVGLLSEVAAHLKKHNLAVGIMPEGTRNLTSAPLLPFKKGAFHLAIEAQADIVIIVSSRLETIARLETRTLRRGVVNFVALPPISVQGMTSDDIPALSETVRAKMLAALAELKTEVR